MAHNAMREIRKTAELDGVSFFKENFNREGFLNDVLEPWEKRKNDIDPGRAILMKSSALRDSIAVFESNNQRIVFGSDEPYAAIHNEGGTIKITVTTKMRKFFWAMYYKTEQERYKYMALTPKQELSIAIPKRQFIGESATLMNELEAEFNKIIIKQFQQHTPK